MAKKRPTTKAKPKARLDPHRLAHIQAVRGITRDQVYRLSDGTLRSLLLKLDIPNRPRLRADYYRLQLVDAKGQMADDAKENALQQLDAMRHRQGQGRRVAGVPAGPQVVAAALARPVLARGAGIAPGASWVPLGPGNIGGRTRSIVVHPTTPDALWIGSVGGGVWHTTDGGTSWIPVDDKMANLAVCCMVMDPTDANVIYAGTGEGFHNVDALRGAGIFCTRDGAQWSQLSATKDFAFVNRLAISSDGKVLLAATGDGIYRSEDPPRLTWALVLAANVADVKFHPTDSKKAVAGGARDGAAYYSTDGGKTWKQATTATPWVGRVELAHAVKSPSTVYASVQMEAGEIWQSTDDGKSYAKRQGLGPDGRPANYLGDQGWYDNSIWAGDPSNANLIVVGGIDLWRSTDGGDNLTRISQWQNDKSVHADHHTIVAHPQYNGRTNKTVFFGNDGGIYKTDDVQTAGGDPSGSQGWVRLVNGYAVTQFYSGVGNPTTGVIIGGAQDNGTPAFQPASGMNSWNEILGGDGGFTAADANDPNYFYAEYVFLDVYRNDDGATSSDNFWLKYISGHFYNEATQQWEWKPLPFQIPDARLQNALFIAPFVLDPNESNRLLAGGASLWRTNDVKTPNTNAKGPTWKAIKAPVSGTLISAIAIASGNADVIWVGYDNGEVYKTNNGTSDSPIWQMIGASGANPLPTGRFCTRIVIDPQSNTTVYAMFGGYTRDNLWRTTNDGADWTNIGTALPEAPVRCLAIHPRKSTFLYVGTEVGLFTSEDSGTSWSPTNEGPTNCSVSDMFWMGEKLVTVTHGRGMFQIDLSSV